jgi:RNA 2',3'-cyclic 3'-phosphodiesterase
VTLARLRNVRNEEIAHYLSSRGNFSTTPFTIGRFVLMSSRDSIGGGPYIVEEAWPLEAPRSFYQNRAERPLEAARTIR